MSSTLIIQLKPIRGPMLKMGAVELFVDDALALTLQMGEGGTVAVAAGPHTVHTVLHGALKRKSRPCKVSLAEGQSVEVTGSYSRLWGNIKLTAG